jgi:hypothetical protein
MSLYCWISELCHCIVGSLSYVTIVGSPSYVTIVGSLSYVTVLLDL